MSAGCVISVRGLHKRYGEKIVLSDVSFTASKGEVVGYIGPNGAGKSTTVKILAGMLTDYLGEVTVMGVDMSVNALEAKERIGLLPENAQLYETLSPLEYLEFIGRMRSMDDSLIRKRASTMLDLLEVGDVAQQRMHTFSKGMKQKVALVATLLHDPEIVLMDEPLSGLDANSVITVKHLVDRLARAGRTVFYCSHMMDVVEKVAHRVVLIDKGVVVASGGVDELKGKARDESLEGAFAELTGKTDHDSVARDLVEAMGLRNP